ncbi:MAG: hypothetical protein ABJB12_03325 [Pseudomonadota bacterium]
MAKIVIVHGMNMQRYEPEPLHRLWYTHLVRLLRRTEWGKANPTQLPAATDVKIAYWADLFRWPKLEDEALVAKGLGSFSRDTYFKFCRGSVRVADKLSTHGMDGRPSNALATYLDGLVAQTAIYMHNGAVYHPDPAAGDGAFLQVQARFRAQLAEDTKLVIGHSLGSVVAYEGLCWKPHRVRSFITVGSPLATPDLILQPMRQRLSRLIGGGADARLPWPQVERWTNFYAGADVWCVPVAGLTELFPAVRDVRVEHGSTLDGPGTHALTSYFEHAPLGDAIAEALK